MSRPVQIRLSDLQLRILDNLVKNGIYRDRTRAIEVFIQESLETRGLINYEEGN